MGEVYSYDFEKEIEVLLFNSLALKLSYAAAPAPAAAHPATAIDSQPPTHCGCVLTAAPTSPMPAA